jgi:hypothetical protein
MFFEMSRFALEISEAARADERLAHDQQRPPVTQHLQGLRDRAVLIRESSSHYEQYGCITGRPPSRRIGRDLHASQQSIAMLDRDTGAVIEKTVKHEGKAVVTSAKSSASLAMTATLGVATDGGAVADAAAGGDSPTTGF